MVLIRHPLLLQYLAFPGMLRPGLIVVLKLLERMQDKRESERGIGIARGRACEGQVEGTGPWETVMVKGLYGIFFYGETDYNL